MSSKSSVQILNIITWLVLMNNFYMAFEPWQLKLQSNY